MRFFLAQLLCIAAADAFTVPIAPATRIAIPSLGYNPSRRFSLPPLRSAAAPSDDPATIQILMSDTGGGHRASANALRDAFDVLHPGKIECDIVDIYTDYGPFWPYNAYVPLYKIMAEYDFLWKAFYEFGCTPFGLWLNEICLEIFCFEPFKECMERPSGSTSKRADMVISVHPLCQDTPLKILSDLDSNGKTRKGGRTTPFVTVVTDLGGAHPTWFNPGVDKCYVPTDALYDCARARKIEPSKIVEYGLPIRKGFWADQGGTASAAAGDKKTGLFDFFSFGKKTVPFAAQPSKSKLRTQLNMTQSVPTVLVVGGGDGMGGIVEIARSLGSKLDSDAGGTANSFQMVVVCGNNENARKTLSAERWGDGVVVHVKGFVNNMDEWMRASDAIVTKAGPGTIAEASICGLPCMLSSFLPGQEEGNIPYVEDSGFGKYSGNSKVIADTVSTWLETPEVMAELRSAALKAARPSATLDIARDLANIVFEHTGKGK